MKAILTYHSIDASGSVISVDAETFRRHIAWLRDEQIIVHPLNRLPEPDCPGGVALTFDDGFLNFATEAWPILREFSMPATVFVVSDRVGSENDWDAGDERIPRLPLMDWTTLAELAREGVTIGAHTRTHPDLRRLTGESLRSEIEGSRDAVANEVGVAPDAFAYPYGRLTPDIVAAVEYAGFSVAVTTEMALLPELVRARWELPRLDAFYLRRPGTLESWGTGSFRRFVGVRGVGRRVRAILARTGISP